nr:hypothetical protein [Tanacetum cinerariifolium]
AAKGKQPAKAKSPSDPSEVARTEAQQLKLVLRRSRQQTHISQLGGSGTDEGTGSSEVAMTKAQQLKLVTKRSLQQTHISQASGSGADEGTSSIPGVPDVPTDESEEELFWNSTDEEGDDDEGKDGDGDDDDDGGDGEEGNGDDDDEDDDGEEGNDDDDDQENEENDDEDDEEKGNDDEQDSDEEEIIHPSLSTHAEEEPRDEEIFDPIPKTPEDTDDEGNGEENLGINVGREEGHNEEEEEDELYIEININQGRGIQTTQEFEDSHVSLTPVNPDGQQQSSSVSSQFVTNMLNPTPDARMESIFETTSQMDAQTPTSVFAGTVSAILEIVHRYMDQQMNEAVQVAVQLQSDRLREEAQKENDEFLKTIDENMQKIIKEQVKEQVKASYIVAANISEMELKKILIEKMEGNKEGKEPESASAPKEKATRSASKSTQGSKSRQTLASKSAIAEEPMQTTFEMEEPAHPEFETCADDQPIVESSQHPEWFSQQKKPPTPDRDWNKTLPATYGSIQPLRQACPLGSLPLGRKRQQFYGFAINRESARDVYSKRRIIAVTELKIVEWHNYKHLNKDNQNKLMRIDELHKFSDGTLTDVRTALDDRVKGIRMQGLLEEGCTRETSGCFKGPYDLSYVVLIFQKPESEGSTQGYPLVSVEVLRYDKRSKSKYMEIVPTEMELILEHTQQGISHEVSVSAEGVEELKRHVKIKGVKKEALLTY